MAGLNVNVSCPLQRNENDIPIVWHDYRGGIQGRRQLLRILNHRDKAISPFMVNGVPVTPYMNPLTKMSSHHIIRVWDSDAPRYVLDLLISDEDVYFVAFQRIKFNTVEEFEHFRTGGGGGQRGHWFSLMDTKIPSFLHATQIAVPSAHGDPRPGGMLVYESIFNSLTKFETDDGGPGPLSEDVTRAICNVMVVYCEVRRLRTLLILTNHLLQHHSDPVDLEALHWALLRNWSDLSKMAQEEWVNGTFALPNLTWKWCIRKCKIGTMTALIGLWGELMKVKFCKRAFGLTESEFTKHWMQAGGNIAEPGFVQQL